MGEEAVRTYLAGDFWHSLPDIDEFLAEGRAASMQIPKRFFFFVNCCFISICPPKKIVDQGGKAEQENALFCIHHHNSTVSHFFSPCNKKSSPSLICMKRVWVPSNPSELDIVPNVWFLLPQLGR